MRFGGEKIAEPPIFAVERGVAHEVGARRFENGRAAEHRPHAFRAEIEPERRFHTR